MSDYATMLEECHITEELVHQVTMRPGRVLTLELDGCNVASSDIHGLGLFATDSFFGGMVIAPASLGGERTVAGRYTNHSSNPNAVMILQDNGDLHVQAINTIVAGDEITIDYAVAITTQRRSNIMQLELQLHRMPDKITGKEMEEDYTEHLFAPGTYSRLMKVPAGLCVVGEIHKLAHTTVLVKGTMFVSDGFSTEILHAPKVWVSPAGTKRALYPLSDCEWLTIHPNPTDTTDLDEIRKLVIARNYAALEKSS